METAIANIEIPVVVTTAHRGVFVGYATAITGAPTITLTHARMIVYYSPATRGLLGLAARGPQPGSRVTSAAAEIALRDVTSVSRATAAAAEAWEAEPWS